MNRNMDWISREDYKDTFAKPGSDWALGLLNARMSQEAEASGRLVDALSNREISDILTQLLNEQSTKAAAE